MAEGLDGVLLGVAEHVENGHAGAPGVDADGVGLRAGIGIGGGRVGGGLGGAGAQRQEHGDREHDREDLGSFHVVPSVLIMISDFHSERSLPDIYTAYIIQSYAVFVNGKSPP